MESIRKWLYKPKKDDKSLLAQFFYADEDLNIVANELDSFDGRKDPERCTALVNQLRQSQDKVLTITNAIMDVLIGNERADRDFRVKFPEDVLQENLAGQLWFGAECLAAGSSIMNREAESTAMRPLAKAVTKSLDNVRNLLRDACLRHNTPNGPIRLDSNELVTEMLLESLKIFDKLFAEFELAYVSAMVPVKSTQEYELQELIGVLFSETLQRALKMNLLGQDMVDDCDPALMFTIPRLAIVSGLLLFPDGPLCIDNNVDEMSEMFRPFRTLLHKIRELLWTLNKRELYMLEKLLCDNEQIGDVKSVSDVNVHSDLDNYIDQFYNSAQPYSVCCDSCFHKSELSNISASVNHLQRMRGTSSIAIPSTSGSSLPNNVIHNTLTVSASSVPERYATHIESPPDQDSLQIISVAAATLSSILTSEVNRSGVKSRKKIDPESPDDSGICTETTSLDRSPSLEINEVRNYSCPQIISDVKDYTSKNNLSVHSNGQQKQGPDLPIKNKTPKVHSSKLSRKKSKLVTNNITEEDDLSCVSSSDDTSSYNSNVVDEEELALAIQAAEIAERQQIRAKYRSSEDLIHRLFVCIAGVADQLQTNFACDLRNILKSVFLINASDNTASAKCDTTSLDASIEYHPSEEEVIENNEFSVDPNILAQEALFDTNVYFQIESDTCPEYSNHPRQNHLDDNSINSLSSELNRYASLQEDVANLRTNSIQNSSNDPVRQETRETIERPPKWIPDVQAPKCMSCGANFTVVKRRHHCRNCGKVFCARCSSNTVPLPKFGHIKPVRVCNKCFIYNLTPFNMNHISQ